MIEIGNVVDIEHFNTTVLDAYAEGDDDELEADLDTAKIGRASCRERV